MNKTQEIGEGTRILDEDTGVVYEVRNGELEPIYREGQNIPRFLANKFLAGLTDLPFVAPYASEYFSKLAKQYAPSPDTWAHTAGDVAELIGGAILPGSAWGWSARGLAKLPWLRRAAELPWLKGLPARVVAGAGAGAASDIMTRGHKMTPEEVAHSALLGGIIGGLFRGAFPKKKPSPVASTGEKVPPPEGGAISPSAEGASASDVQDIERTVAESVEGVEKRAPGVVAEATPAPPPSPSPTPSAPTPPSVPPPLPFSTSQPWPPRPRYGLAFGNIGQSSETFPYLTRDDTAKLVEQIRRSTGATIPPLRTQTPVTPPPPPFQLSEVPRIRWGEGSGPLTVREARKAASDIRKQLKGKRAVVIGSVPLLLDEDDIIHWYVTQIANQE